MLRPQLLHRPWNSLEPQSVQLEPRGNVYPRLIDEYKVYRNCSCTVQDTLLLQDRVGKWLETDGVLQKCTIPAGGRILKVAQNEKGVDVGVNYSNVSYSNVSVTAGVCGGGISASPPV